MFEKIIRKKIDNIDNLYFNFLVDTTELNINLNNILDSSIIEINSLRNRISYNINKILIEYDELELLMTTDEFKEIKLDSEDEYVINTVKEEVLEFLKEYKR
ncbi:hypothetical protein [Romboutsia timonensis]|uniref:hypothetical protein n=1 Tax=Romboutsia timonensis TaxID=1776391 RepID=UPI0023F89688|nr:hypothetical protein [Romboutsia timonensis]